MRATTAGDVANCVGGALGGDPGTEIRRVTTDTRGVVREGDLFVALRGPRFDGGAFASSALAAGAAAVVVSQETPVESGHGAVIRVDDTLNALQSLAAAERATFAGTVVAITGSNGKSTTKEMLRVALSGWGRIWASPMSYNSQVGVALSLLELDPDAEVAIVECGISRPGEMARLEAMVRPTHGIFVTVSDAHLEGLKDRETTAREKAELFRRLAPDAWCLVPATEALAIAALEHVDAPVQLVRESGDDPGQRLSPALRVDAALALEAAVRLGADAALAAAALRQTEPPPMRLEMTVTPRGVTVINDAWTADPASMEAALGVLSRASGRRIAVLGGMEQLGSASQRAHAEVGERVAELGMEGLIGVGPGGEEIVRSAVVSGMPLDDAVVVADVRAAASAIEERVGPGDTVLLKASRPVGLERIAPLLFGSVEPARAHVDLDVLVENLRALEQWVGPKVAVMPVIKAFGYGLDAARLALSLERAGAKYFCVAYAEEGVALRDAGVTTPILVQNVVPDDAPKVVATGLTAEVGTLRQVALVAAAAEAARRPTRVHLKVDTGMGRAGVRSSDAVALAAMVQASQWLEIEGLMTHFAASDEPEHDDYTRAQIERFEFARLQLEHVGVRPHWIHACNSAAIARFPEAHYTMVRAGIGLFGYDTVEGNRALSTRPVLRLTTRVVAVKEVEAGDFVGYGLTWRAPCMTRVAIVALGYGDGYPRALSGRGWMSVGGVRCPVIGRVCMDVTMLDVSSAGVVKPGDEVVAYGGQPGDPDLGVLAVEAETIPYELLTRLSGRVRRIFHGSG